MMSSSKGVLISLWSSDRHSDLYNECPQGWKGERKLPLFSLWFIVDKPAWVIYSSNQWFRAGRSDLFKFSLNIGDLWITWKEF